MKDEQVPVHELEHAEPTVIHHPSEDMTVLARWLQHAMEQGARFWTLVVLFVVVVAALALISSGVLAGRSSGGEAWSELTQAKTVKERLEIADAHPGTPVAGWAKLLAAEEEYANGVDDLTTPGRKEMAGPRLAKALELFQQVAQDAKSPSQAVGGLFGAARTLEARNELDQAIDQYKKVVEKFPDTPEAQQSKDLIKALDEPTNRMFYKELYAYIPKATPTTSDPATGLGGPGSIFKNPDFNLGLPPRPTTPAGEPAPAGLDDPPPTTPTPSPTLEPPKAELPKDEPAKGAAVNPIPPPAETPKPEAPKAEAVKPIPPPAEAPK
jgi:hypothetical protein